MYQQPSQAAHIHHAAQHPQLQQHGPQVPTQPNQPVTVDRVTKIPQPGDDMRRKAQLEQQEYLRQQMEEKERKKQEEKERQRLEDEREAQRLEQERERMRIAYEEEQRKLKEKEEKARQEAERMKQEAADKRKRLQQQAEEREKAAREKFEREQREMAEKEAQKQPKTQQSQQHQQPTRSASPPLPTLQQQGQPPQARRQSPPLPALQKPRAASPPIPTLQQQQPEQPFRSTSPPIPTLQQQPPAQPFRSTSPPIPTLQQSPHTQRPPSQRQQQQPPQQLAHVPSYPSYTEPAPAASHHSHVPTQHVEHHVNPALDSQDSKDVIGQLAKLRARLHQEQDKVDRQLKHGQEEFQRLQDSGAQKQLQSASDVFDRVRKRAEQRRATSASRQHRARTPLRGGAQQAQQQADAVAEFNRLKYGGALQEGQAYQDFKQMYPTPPSDLTEFDKQQRALLDQQTREMQRLAQAITSANTVTGEQSYRPASPSGVSQTSFNIDAVEERNRKRLERLAQQQQALTDASPEALLQSFLQKRPEQQNPTMGRSVSSTALDADGDSLSLVADTSFQPH
eukprot:m.45597 g.45597  ORF g.45597 m.45597 type:complete len:566 (+) comp10891_c1_seq1:1350-3047(+)